MCNTQFNTILIARRGVGYQHIFFNFFLLHSSIQNVMFLLMPGAIQELS